MCFGDQDLEALQQGPQRMHVRWLHGQSLCQATNLLEELPDVTLGCVLRFAWFGRLELRDVSKGDNFPICS